MNALRDGTRRLVLVAATLAVLAAACGGGGGGGEESAQGPPPEGGAFSAANLGRFSIESDDVPSGFKYVADESGEKSAECFTVGPKTRDEQVFLDQLRGLGLQACYTSKYRKKTEDSTEEIGSIAILFRDEAAASKGMALLRDYARSSMTGGDVVQVPRPNLGNEATEGLKVSGESPVEGVMYLWRTGNVAALVASFHLPFTMTDQGVLQVAKKVDFRATTRSGG